MIAVLFTIISVTAINCWQMVLENFDHDCSFSLAAAKNLAEGNGYTIKMASASDLSTVYYEPLNKWPPGYSLLLMLVWKLSGTDWIQAAYILNAIVLTALVLVFRSILLQLEYPSWIVHPIVLFFGFIPHAFLSRWFSDMMCVLFFMLGFSLLLYFVKRKRKTVWPVLLAAFLFSFCAFLKYLYLGLAVVPIVCLFWYGYRIHHKQIIRSAVAGFIVVLMGISLLLIYQFQQSGKAMYINESASGFFPEQLLLTGPLIPASFLNLNFYSLQISLHAQFTYEKMMQVWSVINLLSMAGLLFTAWKWFRGKRFIQKDYRSFYAMLAAVFSLSLMAFLGFLSVTQSKNYPRHTAWTYVQEMRYFGVFSVLLIQWLGYLYLSAQHFFGKMGSVIFRFLMVIILIMDVFHGTYFLFKKVVVEKSTGLQRPSEQIDLTALALTRKEMLKNQTVIVCSNLQEILNICSLAGAAGINDLSVLNKPFRTSRPIVLLTIMNTRYPVADQSFLSFPSTVLEKDFSGVYYYITRIPKSPPF